VPFVSPDTTVDVDEDVPSAYVVHEGDETVLYSTT